MLLHFLLIVLGSDDEEEVDDYNMHEEEMEDPSIQRLGKKQQINSNRRKNFNDGDDIQIIDLESVRGTEGGSVSSFGGKSADSPLHQNRYPHNGIPSNSNSSTSDRERNSSPHSVESSSTSSPKVPHGRYA